jgi:hypothetical protein
MKALLSADKTLPLAAHDRLGSRLHGQNGRRLG